MGFFGVLGTKPKAKNVLEQLQALLNPAEPLEVSAYPNRAGRPKALDDTHVILMIKWKADGVNNCEIGRRLGISETTVRRYLRDLSAPENNEKIEYK